MVNKFPERMLSLLEGFDVIGVGKTKGYEMIRSGELIKPRRISARRRGFLYSELVDWMRNLPKADDNYGDEESKDRCHPNIDAPGEE